MHVKQKTVMLQKANEMKTKQTQNLIGTFIWQGKFDWTEK